MKKRFAVSLLILGIMVSITAYAFEGKHEGYRAKRMHHREILNQLPREKEMLFHETMRDIREKTAPVHEKIRVLHEEIRDILTAPEFHEVRFREKAKEVDKLRREMHDVREEAIVKLAKQFTPEERKILAELFPSKSVHRGRLPKR